jgi:hypothetical protein
MRKVIQVLFDKTRITLGGGVRRTTWAGLCLAGLAAASLAAPAVSAQASTQKATPSRAINGTVKVPSARSVLAYWTPARLRQAKSADVIIAGKTPKVQAPTAKTPGKAGQVAGGLPNGQGLATVRATKAVSPLQFSYPYPYDSFEPTPSLWPTFPYDLNGKLFFLNDGTEYVCSATSVASASGTSDENEIWTAGHCLVNTEALNKIVDNAAIFIPAYNGNVPDFDPYGEFVWNGGWETTTAWYDNRDLTEDEAAMTVGLSTKTGHTLGQTVGWDGFAWNYPVDEQFVAFGYPAASPYNGLNLIEDIAATAGQDTITRGANPVQPIVIGNPMTGGSSGGAWNIDWTTSSPGYINGHNDYRYTDQPLAIDSPYQDTLSNEVRCFGASSC